MLDSSGAVLTAHDIFQNLRTRVGMTGRLWSESLPSLRGEPR